MITDSERLAALRERLQAAETESPEVLRAQIATAEAAAQADAATETKNVRQLEQQLAELHKGDAAARAAIFAAFETLAKAFEVGWLHSCSVANLRRRLEAKRDGSQIPALRWTAEGAPSVPSARILFGADCAERLREWAEKFYGKTAKVG